MKYPIKLPESFFYEINIEGNEFTEQPTNFLSVERIIDNQADYWISNEAIESRNKKTLIVNDWSLNRAGTRYRQHKINFIKELLELSPPFEIYAAGVNELLPVTLDNIHLFFNNSTPLLTKDELDIAIENKGLLSHQCLHLDYALFHSLQTGMNENKDEHNQEDKQAIYNIYISDLMSFGIQDTSASLENILSIVASYLNDRLIKIVVDVYSKKSIDFFETNLARLKDLAESFNTKICYQFSLHKLSREVRDELILDQTERGPTLRFNETTAIHLGCCFKNIESIEISPVETSPDVLSALLNQCADHLKKLEFPLFEIGDFDKPLKLVKNLTALKKLVIKQALYSEDQVNYLLSKCKQLESIDLSQSNILDKIDWTQPGLSTLTKISINAPAGYKLNAQVLVDILTHCKNLKTLEIRHAKISGEFQWPDNENLKLEAIKLNQCNDRDAAVVHQIVERSKELKILDLYFTGSDPLNWQGIKLNSLEELIYSGGKSILPSNLFEHSPKLKKITTVANIINQMSFDNVQLDSLEELHLNVSSFTLSPEKQIKLLSSAPSLKLLEISGESLSKEVCSAIALPSLESLSIHSTEIDPDSLILLLNTTQELKAFSCSSENKIQSMANEKYKALLKCLEKVESIEFTEKSLRYHPYMGGYLNLEDLLLNTRNLKKLSLNYESLKVISFDVFTSLLTPTHKNETSINHIEEISIETDDNVFSDDFSEVFLKTFKNLKKVTLKTPTSLVPFSGKIMTNGNNASSAAGSRNPNQTAAPRFDINQYYNKNTPCTEFEYQGSYTILNQKMVIDQLSQYLTITQQHQEIIPKMQSGICFALSSCFLESIESWNDELKIIQCWNGTRSGLTEHLKAIFNKILQAIREDVHQGVSKTYLGDYLEQFLENARGNFLIDNPWHRIAVSFDMAKNKWRVYDPNSPTGTVFVRGDKLAKLLIKQLGGLLSVVTDEKINAKNTIRNVDQFLANGGFLLIATSTHSNLLNHVKPKTSRFTTEARRGLFICDISSTPAWVNGLLNQSSKNYFSVLIKNFHSINDYKRSLSALPENARTVLMEIVSKIKQEQDIPDELLSSARSIARQWQCQNSASASVRNNKGKDKANHQMLETEIEIVQPSEQDLLMQQWVEHYCEQIINENRRESKSTKKAMKVLIQTETTEAQHESLLKIYQRAMNKNRPVFWVNHPRDLCCSSSWIENNNGSGRLQNGPGGPLYEFLMAHSSSESAPLLLINYENFKAQDIIRFNNLLDDCREADGIALPENLQIVGVQNTKHPKAYLGEDFLSRFDRRMAYVESPAQAEACSSSTLSNAEVIEIDLYHSNDWRQRLLGYWQINGQDLTWIEGKLYQAARENKDLIIYNGPEHDCDYQLFWKRLAVDKALNNAPIQINIHHQTGYNWASLLERHQFIQAESGQFNDVAIPLCNRASFSQLFAHYVVDNDCHGLRKVKGLLKKTNSNELSLLLTENLSPDHWAKLLSKANQSGLTLRFYVLEGVELPEEFPAPEKMMAASSSSSSMIETFQPVNDAFVYTNDIDASLVDLRKIQPEAICIDISDLEPSDLLDKMNAGIEHLHHRFKFEKQQGYLEKALETSDASFILSGEFKPSLFNALLPYVREYPGRIILVSENLEQMRALSPMQALFDFEQKLGYLSSEEQHRLEGFDAARLQNFSVAQLKALAAYQELRPDNKNPRAPWDNYYSLSNNVSRTLNMNFYLAGQKTEEFINNRFQLLESHLSNNPFVFIGGITGVGKSTFIQEHFASKYPGRVYLTEDKIADWANNPEGGYLFIDEANISQRSWSEFEGLFQQKPQLFINGSLKTLSPHHKVIFAGNPLNYGGSRQQARLFERHGHSVLFEPLPPEVIFHSILYPVFQNSILEQMAQDLSMELLRAYQLMVAQSQEEILITPRQIKAVAMLCLAEYSADNTKDAMLVLKKYIQLILNPQAQTTDLKLFDEIPVDTKDFTITRSRVQAVNLINQFLQLRTFKQQNKAQLNDTQKYGDLCSMVLESMPGLGKTELLKAMMEAKGIAPADITSPDALENVYYHVPVSLSLEKKTAILTKAFNEGNIVIIDEINSSPMIERLINALLSGKTPEGNPPENPGFLLFGTQNPCSMGARIAQTEAQNKRMVKIELPKYSEDEIQFILQQKGLPEFHAMAMAKAFKRQENIDESRNITAMNFRELQRMAEENIINGPGELKVYRQNENEQIKSMLHSIFNNRDYWNTKTWGSELPTTVLRMKRVLDNNGSIDEIKRIALHAASKNCFVRFFRHRHDDTHRFYRLFNVDNSQELLDNILRYTNGMEQEPEAGNSLLI